MNTTLQSRAGSVLTVKPPQNSIKKLQENLETVEDSITNNLQLESLKSNFVWESYDVLKLRKIGEKILTRFQSFLLRIKMGGNGNI